MITLQKRKIFAYIAIVLPLLGALGCLIANIVMNDFLHFDDNPLPKNIFDLPSLVLVIFWIVGGILVLTTKSWLTENDLLPHFRDSKGREWVVKDPDIMESMLSFVLPIILNVLVMPFLAVAIIYYPIYFLLSVVVAIFPWIVVAILTTGLILCSVRMFQQLTSNDSKQYLNIIAGHKGLILITLTAIWWIGRISLNKFLICSITDYNNIDNTIQVAWQIIYYVDIISRIVGAAGAIGYAYSCHQNSTVYVGYPVTAVLLKPCEKGLATIFVNCLVVLPFVRTLSQVFLSIAMYDYVDWGISIICALLIVIVILRMRVKNKDIFREYSHLKLFMVSSVFVVVCIFPIPYGIFVFSIAFGYVLPKCLYSAAPIPLDDENSDNESQSLS